VLIAPTISAVRTAPANNRGQFPPRVARRASINPDPLPASSTLTPSDVGISTSVRTAATPFPAAVAWFSATIT
jgi:hypothetical protein